MGIVEEVGSAVTHIAPGDRVVIPFNISCGHCTMCGRGLQSQCETTQVREYDKGAALFGYTKLYGQVPGGQAELLRVPQAQYGPIKVPEGPPDDRFVYLSDVLPTAWQAVQYAAIPDGGTRGCPRSRPDRRRWRAASRPTSAAPGDRRRPRPRASRGAEAHGAEVVDLSTVGGDVVVAIRDLLCTAGSTPTATPPAAPPTLDSTVGEIIDDAAAWAAVTRAIAATAPGLDFIVPGLMEQTSTPLRQALLSVPMGKELTDAIAQAFVKLVAMAGRADS